MSSGVSTLGQMLWYAYVHCMQEKWGCWDADGIGNREAGRRSESYANRDL
jgi:hypothetical protein